MSHERRLGRRDGIRWAITYLHKRAEEMNDSRAKLVLNSAAFDMGVEGKLETVTPNSNPVGCGHQFMHKYEDGEWRCDSCGAIIDADPAAPGVEE
jgi:transposase